MRYSSSLKILGSVLVIALSLMGISCYSVSAATVDDLREVIGDRRISDESLMDDVRSIAYTYKQAEYREKVLSLLDSEGDFGFQKQFQQLLDDKDSALEDLSKSFRGDEEFSSVIKYVNVSVSVLKDLGALKNPNAYINDLIKVDKPEEAYQYALSVINCKDNDYDLGDIGEGLRPPTNTVFRLKYVFGKNRIFNSEVNEVEKDGITLYTSNMDNASKKVKILCQFNGVVKEITKKKQADFEVVIEHGDALQTVYRGLDKVIVKKGEKIKQYDLIGTTKQKQLELCVLLNTVPINPLFLYGGNGERAYIEWYASNPSMEVEKVSFEKVSKYVAQPEVDDNESIKTTVTVDGEEKEVNLEGSSNHDAAISDWGEEQGDE